MGSFGVALIPAELMARFPMTGVVVKVMVLPEMVVEYRCMYVQGPRSDCA